MLEHRTVPALFTVNILADLPDPTPNDGVLDDVDLITAGNQYSLRGALQTANSNNNPNETDVIQFTVQAGGTFTLTQGVLPAITEPVSIDAVGWMMGGPMFNLNGNGQVGSGFTIQAGGVTIAGLAVYGFEGDGIRISNPAGSAGCTVRSCYIGTDITGMAANIGNAGYGVVVYGADNVIGSWAPGWLTWGSLNVISGNGQGGVLISGPGAARNLVASNLIGVKRDGVTPLPNKTESGVVIKDSANNNTIGGSTALALGPVNVISGNGSEGSLRHGVEITGANLNKVFGNYIGLGWDGLTVVGNMGSGVALTNGATSNMIGQAAGYGNIISGNHENGVYLAGQATTGNIVTANYVGTDWFGTLARGNTLDGVRIDDAPQNTIGGANWGDGNVISGNRQNGVYVTGAAAVLNVIKGNCIGMDNWGMMAVANLRHGVLIQASRTTIGGSNAGEGNLIAGNAGYGVRIERYLDELLEVLDAAERNTIAGNRIGLGFMLQQGNGASGVSIASNWNTVGGTGRDGRNIISGNRGPGVEIRGGAHNTVANNFIGTDSSGTMRVPNSFAGVSLVDGAADNTIGGTMVNGEPVNVISGNGVAGTAMGYGVFVEGRGTSGNVISGNYIGTTANGMDPLENNSDGVYLGLGSSNTTIGGAAAGQRNVISANGRTVGMDNFGYGIEIHVSSTGNRVENNYFGLDKDGNAGMMNSLVNKVSWWNANEMLNTFLNNRHN